MTIVQLTGMRAVQVIITLFAFFMGITRWSKLDKSTRVFTIVLILSASTEILSYTLYKIGINPNASIYIYGVVEMLLLLYFFYLLLSPNKGLLVILIGVLIISFYLLNWSVGQKDTLNTYSFVTVLIFKLVLTLSYYLKLINRPQGDITNSPSFWICTGVFVYAAGALFFYLVADYLINVLNNDMILYTSVNIGLLIVEQLIFTYAMWLSARAEPEFLKPKD